MDEQYPSHAPTSSSVSSTGSRRARRYRSKTSSAEDGSDRRQDSSSMTGIQTQPQSQSHSSSQQSYNRQGYVESSSHHLHSGSGVATGAAYPSAAAVQQQVYQQHVATVPPPSNHPYHHHHLQQPQIQHKPYNENHHHNIYSHNPYPQIPPPVLRSSDEKQNAHRSSSFSRKRSSKDRPVFKLTTSLIDTYKNINRVYYEEKEASESSRSKGGKKGARNHGWDDEHYDYIITEGELFLDRYEILTRIGKGSFGQVVRAFDRDMNQDVAIKIIKSKKPFLMQAKTEIDLLSRISNTDRRDEHNIVRLQSHFMYRNHQCLVFEMLSLNLYELLKNTQFDGVSLVLIQKFAKQILRALSYLARPDVDIIHCDLKPENILLRHHNKSGIKVIDFGSSCRSNKRMYSYIQSRFYRSPEVILGLPYSVAIDMWSLGCILVEMHTGEPLFSGSDQVDQMQKIVKILGMPPHDMIEKSADQTRSLFFEKYDDGSWNLKDEQESFQSKLSVHESLTEVIKTEKVKKKKFTPNEAGQSSDLLFLFVDLLQKIFVYDPALRIKPDEALNHPFVANIRSSVRNKSSASENDDTNHNFKRGANDGSGNLSSKMEQDSLSRNKSFDTSDMSSGVSTRSATRRVTADRSLGSPRSRTRRAAKSGKQSEN